MLPRGSLIGAVHLGPLPGSPRHAGADFVAPALADARRYVEAGFDAVIVENFGDAPFWKEALPPETVAALAVAAGAVRAAFPSLPLGVNALRNDARAALGVAAATGASFIRVNVHAGAAVTDQGIIEGRAAETLRARRALGLEGRVALLADVRVKHARPLAEVPLEVALEEAALRGLADGVIVTGPTTGRAPEAAHVARAREAVIALEAHLPAGAPRPLLLLGSGLAPENAPALAPLVDAAIVGTAAKRGGVTANEVDPARAAALAAAWRAARAQASQNG